MLSILDRHSQEYEVTYSLLQSLRVKVTPRTLKKEIEEHPHYPSLLCISDVLNKYGVENITASFKTDSVAAIPPPYITRLKSPGGNKDLLVTVYKKEGDHIHFHDPEKHTFSSSIEKDFVAASTGVVLLAEATENAGEPGYSRQLTNWRMERLSKYLLLVLAPLLILSQAWDSLSSGLDNAIWPILFSLLTFAGLTTTLLLLAYETDQHNPLLKQICGLSEKVNCGKVLQSKAASIGGISWSIIGFTYFAGSLLTQLFHPTTFGFTTYLNLLALPYVPFSVYYQWKVIRQWCPLCLAVQAILVLQGLTSLAGHLYKLPAISIHAVLLTGFAYLIPGSILTFIMPVMKKSKEAVQLTRQWKRLKQDPAIFEGLLSQRTNIPGPGPIGITLGNPLATQQIIKVCSPYCHPCSLAHPVIEDLLEHHPDVQVRIIFKGPSNSNDAKWLPAKHLMAIAATGNEVLIKQALDDWYLADKKDYAVFSAKYPLDTPLELQDAAVAEMQEWCQTADIRYTPTILMTHAANGPGTCRELPDMYSVNDLKYFLSV